MLPLLKRRNAINAPIQGTAADIIKKAMINIYAWLQEEKLGTRMILQVHDELVFDAVQEEVEYITPKIKELMTLALLLHKQGPLPLGGGPCLCSSNWIARPLRARQHLKKAASRGSGKPPQPHASANACQLRKPAYLVSLNPLTARCLKHLFSSFFLLTV